MTGRIETGPGWELREGRWQDVLVDVEADALISDPPYSARTHGGHDATQGLKGHNALEYPAWTDRSVAELVGLLSVKGWRVALTDHVLAPSWEQAYREAGLYPFAPLPYVAPGSRVRLAGDGPSSWSLPVMVARPRHEPYSRWGTLPGAYILPPGQSERGADWFVGGKPLWLMRSLVRDYSRPGDLIVDPCAGSGTTLLAAVIEGRRAIGAEMDPSTFDLAVARLRRGYTPSMFQDTPPATPEQCEIDMDTDQ